MQKTTFPPITTPEKRCASLKSLIHCSSCSISCWAREICALPIFSVYPGNDNAALPLKQERTPWKRGWFTACWLWCHVLRWDASWETTVLHQFLFLGQEPILCSWLWVLFFLLEELSFCFGFWIFDFACMLFLRVLDFYFRVLSVCLVLRASRELSVFDILWCCPDSVLYLNLWFWFLSCASVLESVFLFWGLVFMFGFCGLHFPYLPRYIFNSRISVNLFTGGNLTRLSISWQFRQEKGSIISEFKQVCTYVSAVFFLLFFSRSA